MVASQVHWGNVWLLTECLTITPMLMALVVYAHHSAAIVKHGCTSADSVVEYEVALHQPDAFIGQVCHRMSLETLMQCKLNMLL